MVGAGPTVTNQSKPLGRPGTRLKYQKEKVKSRAVLLAFSDMLNAYMQLLYTYCILYT